MPNFNMYTKTTEQVFELNKKLTLKINVYFNEHYKLQVGDEIQNLYHNEFIVSGTNITTNLKYRYNLQLSPKGDYDNSIYIDWDNYDDFFTAIESVINISNPDNPRCPFIRKYSDTGDLLDIQFNTMNTKYFIVKDKYRNILEIIPSVLYNKETGEPLESFVFRINMKVTFDVPLCRLKGLRRFMNTYNPLLHASAITKYMAMTPQLGTNRNNMTR